VETEEAQVAERYAEVLDALPQAPEPDLTREELLAATGWKRWAVRSAIKELVLAGVVETSGGGTKDDPLRHRKRAMEDSGGPVAP
jgi:hypothetical protein